MKKAAAQQHGMGILWVIGWLFSIGFLHLAFWKAVFAIILWPYYLGVAFTAVH